MICINDVSSLWRTDELGVPPHQGDFRMSVDNLLGGAVALALLAYLIYALIRPEKF